MSQRSGSDQVEFIRLDGTAIRVTSWSELDPDHFRLIAIVRGAGEARALADLLSADTFQLEVPGHESRRVSIAALDRRETGTPPAIITRFAVDLSSASTTPSPPETRTLDERVADLEREVQALRNLIEAMANDR